MSQTTPDNRPDPALDAQSGAFKQPHLEGTRGREHMSPRHTRSGTGGLWIAVGVLTVLVLLPPGSIYTPSVLSAKRISLVDDAGRELACLVTSKNGEGLVVTRNAQGKDLVLLTVSSEAGNGMVVTTDGNGAQLVELGAHEHGGNIVTRNRAGQPAVAVGVGEEGRGLVAVFAEYLDPHRTSDKQQTGDRKFAPHVFLAATKNGGTVAVNTEIGTSAAILGTDDDGVGTVVTYLNGHPRVRLYANKDGAGQLGITDLSGHDRVHIGLGDGGYSPHIALNSDKGGEVVYIGDPLEHGIIRMHDNLGRETLTLDGGFSTPEVVLHNENGIEVVKLGAGGGGGVFVNNARGDEACALRSGIEGSGWLTVKGPEQAQVSIGTTGGNTFAGVTFRRHTGVLVIDEQGYATCNTSVEPTGRCIWAPGR